MSGACLVIFGWLIGWLVKMTVQNDIDVSFSTINQSIIQKSYWFALKMVKLLPSFQASKSECLALVWWFLDDWLVDWWKWLYKMTSTLHFQQSTNQSSKNHIALHLKWSNFNLFFKHLKVNVCRCLEHHSWQYFSLYWSIRKYSKSEGE